MKNLFKLTNITKILICAFLFVLTITPNNVFAVTNTKKVSAVSGRVTVTFKYALTTTPKVTDFGVTQVINKGTAKTVKPTKVTMNSTKKIVTLTIPVVAKTSIAQSVVYKVSYKKDIIVSSTAITVAKVTVIVNPVSEPVVGALAAINITKEVGDIYTLPTTVMADISDGTTKSLAVTWDKLASTTVVGTYIFTGTLTMVDGIVNANNITITAKLIVKKPINAVVMVTVKTAPFGAYVTATSNQEGATQYQIFSGTIELTAKATLGTQATMFPAKAVGDTVIINLLNADGIVIGTANVTLVAPGSKVTTPVAEPTTPVIDTSTPVTNPTTSDSNTISAPVGDAICPSGLGFYMNSADGIMTYWQATNQTGKTINYYTVNVSMYNAVGDPATSDITGSSKIIAKSVGPVLPNKSLLIYSILAYSKQCTKIVIDSIYLQYSDGTSVTIPYGYTGTETVWHSAY